MTTERNDRIPEGDEYRIIHGRAEIWNSSSLVHLDISRLIAAIDYVTTLLVRSRRLYLRFKKGTLCHSFMALTVFSQWWKSL